MKREPNWAIIARLIGLGVGAAVFGALWFVGHPVIGFGAGALLGAVLGAIFWIIRTAPAPDRGKSWTPGDLQGGLSPYGTVARDQTFAPEATEAQIRRAVLVREAGRRRSGLDVRFQVLRFGSSHEVEVVADDCTEPMARSVAAACGGWIRRLDPAQVGAR